jgi:hypothetical protein
MENKKITYHNNHLMYINQDAINVLHKKSLWSRCKDYLTNFIIIGTIIISFISLAYIVYTIKYLY